MRFGPHPNEPHTTEYEIDDGFAVYSVVTKGGLKFRNYVTEASSREEAEKIVAKLRDMKL